MKKRLPMNRALAGIATTAAWLWAAYAAQADVIAEYTFDGGTLSNQATASLAEVRNISDIYSVGVLESGFVDRGSGDEALFGVGWPKSNVEHEYFAFAFDVVAGNPVALEGFSVDITSDFRTNFAVKLFGSEPLLTLFPRQQPPDGLDRFRTYALGSLAGDAALGFRLDPGTYEIRIIGTNVNGDNRRLLIDNVRMAATVPEPTALTLWSSLGLAGAALVVVRRRRRSAGV